MIPQKKKAGISTWQTAVRIFTVNCICLLLLFSFACSELEKPKTEPFYSQTAPPPKQEFRWSNGKMPKSFDPALAAAAPETDVVRAVFEGLTDTNPKNLAVIPAIATDWDSTENNKIWTFRLRRDAKWSNGKSVTAEDFVRAWKRLAEIRDKVSHPNLLKNIAGMPVETEIKKETLPEEPLDNISFGQLSGKNLLSPDLQSNANASIVPPKYEIVITDNTNKTVEVSPKPKVDSKTATNFGVEAVDNYTLRVSLVNPDKDFPQIVAHPMFRPIFGNGKEFETEKLNAEIVTNGAFRIVSIGLDGITLDRSENFWNKEIKLERVKFVPTENAEKALEAYRAGKIDALTNVNFEPLVVKLLQPFDDFQSTPHSALNFYEFNRKNAPFNDRRVREALAIAIDRERLTEGEMEGVTKPALSFLPFEESSIKLTKLTQNIDKAKNLLSAAGFSNGENFPKIRLVINRNNVQQKIARSVAKMWKNNLSIETEIIVKETNELAEVKKIGDFDVIRRGVVLPTTDESVNMSAIFEPKPNSEKSKENESEKEKTIAEILTETQERMPTDNLNSETSENIQNKDSELKISETDDDKEILTEETAIIELHAIPLYFPTSYSLIKPYVQGFEMNALDAPSLKTVIIDNNWQPKKVKGES